MFLPIAITKKAKAGALHGTAEWQTEAAGGGGRAQNARLYRNTGTHRFPMLPGHLEAKKKRAPHHSLGSGCVRDLRFDLGAVQCKCNDGGASERRNANG